MSAPKPGTVLLVLALVALVVLFALTVGLRAPDGEAIDKQRLQERWLGSRPKVAPGELEGGACQGLLPAGQRCAFEVAAARALTRTLTVSTQDEVTVVLSPKDQGRDVPVELKRPGHQKSVDLQVGRKGARVEITCRAPVNPQAGCLVHVG